MTLSSVILDLIAVIVFASLVVGGYKKGFLKKWSRPYTAWFIHFIGSDLIVDRPSNARQLIKEVIKIMDDYHMTGGRMKIKALQAFCKVFG